eukprot:1754249-Prymnesium_polylepis.2
MVRRKTFEPSEEENNIGRQRGGAPDLVQRGKGRGPVLAQVEAVEILQASDPGCLQQSLAERRATHLSTKLDYIAPEHAQGPRRGRDGQLPRIFAERARHEKLLEREVDGLNLERFYLQHTDQRHLVKDRPLAQHAEAIFEAAVARCSARQVLLGDHAPLLDLRMAEEGDERLDDSSLLGRRQCRVRDHPFGRLLVQLYGGARHLEALPDLKDGTVAPSRSALSAARRASGLAQAPGRGAASPRASAAPRRAAASRGGGSRQTARRIHSPAER